MADHIGWRGRLTLIRASDDEEDETAELMRELEKIKKERAEQREGEVGPFYSVERVAGHC